MTLSVHATLGETESLLWCDVAWVLRGPFSIKCCLMPQSHLTMGPIQFLAPIRFLDRKAEWCARRNFTMVLFSWSHQDTGLLWFDMALHLWFDKIICRTPHGARVMPLRALYGSCSGISNVFHIPRGPGRVPYVKELTQPEFAKIQHRHRIWPYRTPYGPCTSCSWAVYHL